MARPIMAGLLKLLVAVVCRPVIIEFGKGLATFAAEDEVGPDLFDLPVIEEVAFVVVRRFLLATPASGSAGSSRGRLTALDDVDADDVDGPGRLNFFVGPGSLEVMALPRFRGVGMPDMVAKARCCSRPRNP